MKYIDIDVIPFNENINGYDTNQIMAQWRWYGCGVEIFYGG
jgi:hypothetical protein